MIGTRRQILAAQLDMALLKVVTTYVEDFQKSSMKRDLAEMAWIRFKTDAVDLMEIM